MIFLINLTILKEYTSVFYIAFLHLKNINYNRFLLVFGLYGRCFLHLKIINNNPCLSLDLQIS